MTRENLFPTTAITAILMFLAVSTMAQDSYLKNRWNIKLSGAPQLNFKGTRHNSFLTAEANYGILNNFELGVALGIEKKITFKLKPDATGTQINNDYYRKDYISPTYNLHLNYHLLPYLVKEKHPKFDLYFSGSLGGNFINNDIPDDDGFYWNYYLGGGLAWYFTRNVGVYTEYGKQWPFKGETRDKAKFRFGVTVKF
jgi:hypothetical protein